MGVFDKKPVPGTLKGGTLISKHRTSSPPYKDTVSRMSLFLKNVIQLYFPV